MSLDREISKWRRVLIIKSSLLLLIIGETKRHDSASSHYHCMVSCKKHNIVVSTHFGFSRVSFKVTLNLYHPLLSAFWSKVFVVKTPLARLAQRINKYSSAIAVTHSSIVQFLREIGETNTNFISFSFKKLYQQMLLSNFIVTQPI